MSEITVIEDSVGIRRPAFTQRHAAQVCGVSYETIKRRRLAGDFPGAYQQGGRGDWRIPLDDLLASGLNPGRPSEPDSPATIEVPTVAQLEATVEGLRGQLAEREARVHEAKDNALKQIEAMRGQVLAIEGRVQDADQRLTELRQSQQAAAQAAHTARADAIQAREEAVRWRWAAVAGAVTVLAVLAGLLGGRLL